MEVRINGTLASRTFQPPLLFKYRANTLWTNNPSGEGIDLSPISASVRPNAAWKYGMFVAIHAFLWCDVIFYVVDTFQIFACHPLELIWNKFIVGGTCFDVKTMIDATGAGNVISGFAILISPMIDVWRLQMPKNQRLAVVWYLRPDYWFEAKSGRDPYDPKKRLVTGAWVNPGS
ncbi:hypothetical protein B0J14DRAFT_636432 [Halenospora varia]|nr:hypothetical protein B0J14DRAFT_636432 [Halenospora varia]